MDSAWEQKNLEAKKMLDAKRAAESDMLGAPKKIACDHFVRENVENALLGSFYVYVSIE